jgi:hypothetical protein
MTTPVCQVLRAPTAALLAGCATGPTTDALGPPVRVDGDTVTGP